MSEDSVPTDVVDKAAHERYGEERAGSADDVLRYLKCLKIVAASDGFSEAERRALAGEMRKMGLPKELFTTIDAFDAKDAKIEDFLPPATADHNQRAMLIYDALKLAHADGYSDTERKVLEAAAKKLAVPVATLRALEHVVRTERELRALRHALFQGG